MFQSLIKWITGAFDSSDDTDTTSNYIDDEQDLIILGEVGSGAWGTVSLVRQESTGRLFAAKRAIQTGQEKQLAEEISLCLNVNHCNVAKAYPYYYETAEGGIYILTEFHQGPSLLFFLEKILDCDMRLTVEETARIGRDIALGLKAIHNANLLHRDLSCNNVILHDGNPIIIDFGLAKDSLCSLTGTLCGTPNFIAPEVGFASATPRSDIFSLGALLYLMYFQRYITDDYGRGLALDLRFRKNFKGLEKELVDIIQKAISLNPEDRYSSAHQMAAALKPLSERVDTDWWSKYHNVLYECADCCASCKWPIPNIGSYCPFCGESRDYQYVGKSLATCLAAFPCENCGENNSTDWIHCLACGNEL